MKKGPGGVGLPTYASTPSDRKSCDGRGMGRYVSSKGRVRMGSCGSGSVGVCLEHSWFSSDGGRGIHLDFFTCAGCIVHCLCRVAKAGLSNGLYDDRNVAH